ncbi:MAG: rhamnose/proton symporter RhaT [Planctomycetota bacterium]|nr:MAG: rhamnose/proton symporter RhaT [Planctomycetota bacterium]
MNEFLFPLLLILLASVFQGTFGLGMKYVKPVAWEAWWLVHASVAMLIFPLIWAFLVVPELTQVLQQAPLDEVRQGAVLGFLWGIGGMMFGISVGYIGMSLTYGIVMGLCSLVGSLIPLILRSGNTSSEAMVFVLIGLALLAVGVVICTIAGLQRDKVASERGQQLEGIKTGRDLRIGLVIACVCGVLSAMLAVGFDRTETIGRIAVEHGAVERNSALARWVVVLAGAYLMNAGYAVFLLIKNRSLGSIKNDGAFQALKWAVIAGLLWFAALGTFGQGAALMGELGTVIGWPMLLGLSLIVSNAVGVITGEWKGMAKPFLTMAAGVLLIIVATVVMSYASTLNPKASDSGDETAYRIGTVETMPTVPGVVAPLADTI